ncbi:MAG: MBL fold metallo-hydrolase [Propionibacteriaceae bacterium]
MLIASFPAGPWQTNCYLIATGSDADCVVVDPGVGALRGVEQVVAEHRLNPTDVLLTHGHIDHMYAVAAVCAAYDASCRVGAADRHLITDPLSGMPPGTQQLLAQLNDGVPPDFAEPERVIELADGDGFTAAGLAFRSRHAPGHTAGSTLFLTDYPDGNADYDELLFSGDVLFQGTIGRTDLPGGDHATMLDTLQTVILELADRTVVLPGHGNQTTIAAERAGNPFLVEPDGEELNR